MRNGIIAISLRITALVTSARTYIHANNAHVSPSVVFSLALSRSVNYDDEMQFAVTASVQLSICNNSDSDGMPVCAGVSMLAHKCQIHRLTLHSHVNQMPCNGGTEFSFALVCRCLPTTVSETTMCSISQYVTSFRACYKQCTNTRHKCRSTMLF